MLFALRSLRPCSPPGCSTVRAPGAMSGASKYVSDQPGGPCRALPELDTNLDHLSLDKLDSQLCPEYSTASNQGRGSIHTRCQFAVFPSSTCNSPPQIGAELLECPGRSSSRSVSRGASESSTCPSPELALQGLCKLDFDVWPGDSQYCSILCGRHSVLSCLLCITRMQSGMEMCPPACCNGLARSLPGLTSAWWIGSVPIGGTR